MDTFFARQRLSAYLDGTLSEREAAEVAEAVARDPELSAELDSLRMTIALLRQHGPVSAPEGFHARLMDAVREEPTRGGVVVQLRRFVRRVPYEALAVAAAAMLVVGVFATRDTAPPAPPTAARTIETPPVPDAPAGATHAAASPKQEAPAADGVDEDALADNTVDEAPAPAKAPQPKAVPAAQSPDAAYVPQWEAEQKDSLAGIEGLQLVVRDPDVLRKLAMLAERHGGRMLDESSQNLRPYTLSAADAQARLMLLVPNEAAQELRAQLSGLGARKAAAPSHVPQLARGYAGFYIDVALAD